MVTAKPATQLDKHCARRGAAVIAMLFAAVTTAQAGDGGLAFAPGLPSHPAPLSSSDDKSRYTLFNPTPNRLLRDLSTDRPDMTESPFTVDAGRIQMETNLFGYARSYPEQDGTVTSAYDFATTNIRIGLTHNTELNVVWQPYGSVLTRAPGTMPATRHSGIGSIDLRAKINLWGNDSSTTPGSTAFGLLPFVTLPTEPGNGIGTAHVEAGLIMPFAVRLSDKVGLGLNAGLHALKSEFASAYHLEWLGSASLSYDWTDRLGSYVELAARLDTQDPRGEAVLVATGLTYRLHQNLQLDVGVNIGVTPAADRINPFAGLSARF